MSEVKEDFGNSPTGAGCLWYFRYLLQCTVFDPTEFISLLEHAISYDCPFLHACIG